MSRRLPRLPRLPGKVVVELAQAYHDIRMGSGHIMLFAGIRLQIEEARKLREDAQALLAEYQKKQREAMSEAEKIISNARGEAAKLKIDAEKDLENAITRRKQQALDRIAQSEAQAIAQVRNAAVDVALAAAQQLILTSLDAAKTSALADKAIAELPGRLN